MTSSPPGTPKPDYPQAQIPPTPKQHLSVEPRRTPGNRVIEELRALDERFGNPRCSQCSGPARVAIYTEGPVVVCADPGCKKVERVDVKTLQRLSERLGASCRQCNGTNLQSLTGSFGTIYDAETAVKILRGRESAKELGSNTNRYSAPPE